MNTWSSEHMRMPPCDAAGAFGLGDSTGRLRRAVDQAWGLVCDFRCDDLFAAVPALEAASAAAGSSGDVRAEVATLSAIVLLWRDDVEAAVTLVSSVLALPSAGRFRVILLTLLRIAAWKNRDFSQFYSLSRPRLARALAPTQAARVVNLAIEAAVEAEQLRFKCAERLAKEACRLAANEHNGYARSNLPVSVLASMAYDSGAIDEADALIRGRLAVIEKCGGVESAMLAFAVSARIAAARGHQNVAHLILEQGGQLGVRRGWSRLVLLCMSETVGLLVAEGRIDLARRAVRQAGDWLQETGRSFTDPVFDTWPLDLARARVWLVTGECSAAIDMLRKLAVRAAERHHRALVVRLAILLAGALEMHGDRNGAEGELAAVLLLSAEAGFYQPFVDALPSIEHVLRRIRHYPGAPPDHVGAFVESVLFCNAAGRAGAARKRHPNHGLAEALTDREVVVLRLMSFGLSNKEIARELDITPETIKSHAKRIFIKLAARARTEAVSRGSELGII